jgi:hypothetical protein
MEEKDDDDDCEISDFRRSVEEWRPQPPDTFQIMHFTANQRV